MAKFLFSSNRTYRCIVHETLWNAEIISEQCSDTDGLDLGINITCPSTDKQVLLVKWITTLLLVNNN